MSRKQFTQKSPLKDVNDMAVSIIDPWQDGLAYNQYPLEVVNMPLNFNGSNWDRVRNNMQGVLLASAPRTVYTTSGLQTNYNAKGIIVYLNITVASGTGGLQLLVNGVDPITGAVWGLNPAFASITATGEYVLIFYPGASGSGGSAVKQVVSFPLPRTWRLDVSHGDASSYTYSVGYSYVL